MSSFDVATLPIRNLVEIVPVHPKDGLEIGFGQMTLQILCIDVARQAIVGRLQEVDWINVGGRRKRHSVVWHVG